MYSYEWDVESGGFLLKTTPLKFSKEPRPVYYQELDILGFDQFWSYDKDDTYPYMWAEASNYFYFGRKVAKIKGGTLYHAPEIEILEEPEPESTKLKQVNIPLMVEKNKEIMESLTQETIRKVYNVFSDYKHKVDVFYVAFSGGKDSIVTLDIVQRALPHNEFKVLFGDTGMEFPDTYLVVKKIKDYCRSNNIDFFTAKSDIPPEKTWKEFGPPATVTRWCCSVHKTAPQILKLREIVGKADFTGMAFVGVRASESVSRNDYEYISLGEKHKGQYSCNPILEWNSAELFNYIYSNELIINNAYKKGNNRAGCLVCPNVSEKNSFFRRINYSNEVDNYIGIIKNLYKANHIPKDNYIEFFEISGWKARKNGRDISIPIGYNEVMTKTHLRLDITEPKMPWKEWIKTIGVLLNEQSPYIISHRNQHYRFEVKENKGGYSVFIDLNDVKYNANFVRYLKNVFRKAACCIGCKECEADCHNGYIKMSSGIIEISENCFHCSECHKTEKGCLVFKSLEQPKGGKSMQNKSLNCYSTHAPKIEWIQEFFSLMEEFDEYNSLGSQMYSFFKRFLRDSGLINEDGISTISKKIEEMGIDNEVSWAIMLNNLAYSPQINWYIKNVVFMEPTTKEYLFSLLESNGSNERAAKDIIRSLARFSDLPFNEVGFGYSEKDKKTITLFVRTPWITPEPLVILYSLYKFAEACGDYYQFTLTRLLDHEVDSDGVSPSQIFGLDRESLEKIIKGLSVNYPDYISSSFNLGLDNINLNKEKTSMDIISLF